MCLAVAAYSSGLGSALSTPAIVPVACVELAGSYRSSALISEWKLLRFGRYRYLGLIDAATIGAVNVTAGRIRLQSTTSRNFSVLLLQIPS